MAVTFTKNLSNRLLYGAGGIGAGLNGAVSISIHCWIWIVSVSTTGANQNGIVLNIVNGSSAGAELSLDATSGNPRVRMSTRSVGTDARQAFSGTNNIPTGQWVTIGATVNFTSKVIRTYLNGVPDAVSGTLAHANNSYTYGTPTAEDALGGYFTTTPDTNGQTDGHVGEVGIWKGDIGDIGFLQLARWSPRIVRPQLLHEYFSLIRSGDVNGKRNRAAGTVTGSIPTASGIAPTHPRIIRA